MIGKRKANCSLSSWNPALHKVLSSFRHCKQKWNQNYCKSPKVKGTELWSLERDQIPAPLDLLLSCEPPGKEDKTEWKGLATTQGSLGTIYPWEDFGWSSWNLDWFGSLDLLTDSQVKVWTLEKDNLTNSTEGAQEDPEKVENFKEKGSKNATHHLEKIPWDLCSDTGLLGWNGIRQEIKCLEIQPSSKEWNTFYTD